MIVHRFKNEASYRGGILPSGSIFSGSSSVMDSFQLSAGSFQLLLSFQSK
jgi:hypothetical protein